MDLPGQLEVPDRQGHGHVVHPVQGDVGGGEGPGAGHEIADAHRDALRGGAANHHLERLVLVPGGADHQGRLIHRGRVHLGPDVVDEHLVIAPVREGVTAGDVQLHPGYPYPPATFSITPRTEPVQSENRVASASTVPSLEIQ